jgi:hypothetical protein
LRIRYYIGSYSLLRENKMSDILFFNNHQYQLIQVATNWLTAQQAATNMGGHLAVIETKEENKALSDFLLPLSNNFPSAADGGDARYAWLGASDIETEGSWSWVNDTDFSQYSNWGNGVYGNEPDNSMGTQDTLAMGMTPWPYPNGGLGTAGQWNDINQANNLYYLVEWDSITLAEVQGTLALDYKDYSGKAYDHTISKSANGYQVLSTSGTAPVADELMSVERLYFDDRNLALDLEGNAGFVAKTIGAVFGWGAVANQSYAGIGIQFMDNGGSKTELMALALNAALPSNKSHESVVELLYSNVIGYPPTTAEINFYVSGLENGTYSEESLGIAAAELSANSFNINFTGLQEHGYYYVL